MGKVTEFRVVVSGDDDSSSAITRALRQCGVNVEYVEITACYNDDEEDGE